MSLRSRLDPESQVALDLLLAEFPGGINQIADLRQRRIVDAAVARRSAQGLSDGQVVCLDTAALGCSSTPDVPLRVYRPTSGTGPRPGLLFIHGGGMILGDLDSDDGIASMLCAKLGGVVVSVDYRLAPEHPYPAQVQDCYAGLVWMARNSQHLGLDPGRVGVYGGSAGGALAIATSMLARDRGWPPIVFQMAAYPMLDDRHLTPSSQEVTDVGVWDRAASVEAWSFYLSGQNPDQYAAPARADDLRGLPPTFIDVGEVDVFRDEDVAFASRLLEAGVTTELHVYPGAFHASEVIAPDAALSKRIWSTRIGALRRHLE